MKILCESCQSLFRLEDSLVKPTGSIVRCSKCRLVFRVYPLEVVNRRKYPRVKTRNLISHVSVDENGKLISQGLSKAIDISIGGILLETPHPIESGLISLMAVDAENNFIEINGELIYCKKSAAGIYHSGIKFFGTNEKVVNFSVKLIKEYHHRKNNLFDTPEQ
jgi:predicted Zn finger-like uncharacterized protein